MPPPLGSSPGGDVIITGGGLVGLASAAALAGRGADVTLLAGRREGEASGAAAGMLAPGMERAESGKIAHAFALAARELYPSYVEALAEITGIRVPLNRAGILELVIDEADADARRANVLGEASGGREWIDGAALRAAEPALASSAGAVFYPLDGAVDNVTLLRSLRALASSSSAITVVEDQAAALDLEGAQPAVRLPSGDYLRAPTLVLAAGAWSPLLPGLPRPVPVEPVRGQAISISGAALHHVVYGPRGYLVPRAPSVSVVGATMEHVGFDTSITAECGPMLAAAAAEIADRKSVV